MPENITFACSFQDCTEELGLRKHTCPLCGKNYCDKHSFPEEHNCEQLNKEKYSKDSYEENRID